MSVRYMGGGVNRYTFEEVSYNPIRAGKCVECGKRTTHRTKLYQTINPFNKNEDGTIKTREDIWAELRVQMAEWYAKPLKCSKCDPYR